MNLCSNNGVLKPRTDQSGLHSSPKEKKSMRLRHFEQRPRGARGFVALLPSAPRRLARQTTENNEAALGNT